MPETVAHAFVRCDSSNIPLIDSVMVACFFGENPDYCSAEFRNVKSTSASRESYGDDAVGYVQLKRENGVCTLRCKISPEHRSSAMYQVEMEVDEKAEKVLTVACQDCPAAEGGCKHAVAFLMWAHRRSEEPPCTAVECYWRMAPLANVPIMTLDKIVNASSDGSAPRNSGKTFRDFLSAHKNATDIQLIKHQASYQISPRLSLSLHQLALNHSTEGLAKFLEAVQPLFTEKTLKQVEESTRDQSASQDWFELRYGRITGSTAFSAARCRTRDGTLVALILGGKVVETKAMKRGKALEDDIRKTVSLKIGKFKTCGLFLSGQHIMLAASPDGISGDAVLEIKCPFQRKSMCKFVENGMINERYWAQIQLQMFVTGRKKCYFCVADPEYEENKLVDIYLVNYDDNYVVDLIPILVNFWKDNIFPILQ